MTLLMSTLLFRRGRGQVFIRDKIAAFFDDVKPAPNASAGFLDHAVSDLLVYRTFDEAKSLYINRDSYGFMLELTTDGDVSAIADGIEATMQSSMGSDTTLQILNWASPDVLGPLTTWASTRRSRGEFISSMASARMDYIYSLRFGAKTTVPLVPLDRRIFVCAWKNGDVTESGVAALDKYRSDLINACGGSDRVRLVQPKVLLNLLSQILHCKASAGLFEGEYSDVDFINHQLPGCTLRVSADDITFAGTPSLKARCSTVAKYPIEWRVQMGAALGGDPQKPALRAPGPVLTSFTARAIPQQTAKAQVGRKQEFQDLNTDLENGSRLFETVYNVVGYALEDGFEQSDPEGHIAQIYRSVGLNFSDDRYLQLPVFLGSLPFGMTRAYLDDFKRAMRMRLLEGKVVSKLLPIHRENSGTARGNGMFLLGRQGQVFNWSNFDSAGNYNTSIVGKSGAGKSVFMQDLILSIYAEQGKVVIIDDGRSFERICQMVGGDFVAFDPNQDIKLNPFALIDSSQMEDQNYRSDAVEMITNLIGSMCSLSSDVQVGRVESFEEGYIGQAVEEVWAAHGSKGNIDLVYALLKAASQKEPRISDLLVKLLRFTTGNLYGDYFNSGANLSIDSDFVVFEMAELKSQPVLQEVVLQLIMFLSTEVMFKTDRGTKVALLIDEAWDLLSGPATAKFIESVVRRARKYSGCIICGTQSVDDFLNNPSAKVVFENSDNFICMQQRPETIELLTKDKKISVDNFVADNLKSLKKVSGLFSEMGIYTEDGWIFGRLALDQFSLAVFSTHGETVARLNSYVADGLSYAEAISLMIERGEVK